MEQPTITIILNGNTYRFSASDTKAIKNLPKSDRQQLIALLETVKREEQVSEAAVEQAVNKIKIPAQVPFKKSNPANVSNGTTAKPERLGSGDVDALMSRLIQEEKQNQKPGLTTATIYKWTAGILVVIILAVLIF